MAATSTICTLLVGNAGLLSGRNSMQVIVTGRMLRAIDPDGAAIPKLKCVGHSFVRGGIVSTHGVRIRGEGPKVT